MKNLKIGLQLKLGFAAMLFFVIVLGTVSYMMNNQLFRQIETMYDHPLQVRRSIGHLQSDILSVQLGNRDLLLANTNQDRQNAVQLMEISKEDALIQFNNIRGQYLGPLTDVDEACKAFIIWETAIGENTRLALSGENEKGKESIHSTGNFGVSLELMMSKIQKIDVFATNKGDGLYSTSRELTDSLNRQLILLVVVILLLSLLINYVLIRNIREPIVELTDTSERFHQGDLNARSSYSSKNEFGVLSDSFNNMVENIQMKTESDEKVVSLASLMLSKYEAKEFFHETINALAIHTGSQMAAVYLLSDDHKTFEHFESIGMGDNARQSFAADRYEGEFGLALSSLKVQHVCDIPENTRFTFHTVSGKFIPREILTIPIINDFEVIAVISLASVGKYSKQSVQLIDHILVTLRTRVEGIIAYHKMREFSEKLEQQNRELEAQKTELASQSAELTRQNSELEIQKNQLFEASRLKTNFLSNMSHELRTPLNSVIALSGVLNRRLAKKIPDEEYSYLEVIERNGKHLLSLINDILDISRIESGHEEIEITKFDMNNLITEVVIMIKTQAQQKNIELIHTDSSSNLSIISDADKCRHILQNLVGNAIKFTDTGRVEITARQIDNNIVITVTDTGIGISEKHLPHIFNEFRQADGSTSRKFGGSGLGLAIAEKYANLLGGTISVKSTFGMGSEFTLTLPLSHAAENRIMEEQTTIKFNHLTKHVPHTTTSGLSGKTILLVEDSEPAIVQIKDILEYIGYQMIVAHDGGEALRIIAHTIPDAIILDLMMPGIDGFTVLKTIREEESTAYLPVLILTAKHISKEELSLLKRNNIHQLIQKGDINRNDLQNAVAAMVLPKVTRTVMPKREFQTIEGKPVVLVVEDNPDNMITVNAILADNYTVLKAVDAISGIQMAKTHIPDLILMDVGLPGIDGIEAFKIIRQDAELQHIPVIALTASALTSDRETILAYGLDAYIAKPIDEKLFLKTINSVLYGK